MSRMRVLVVSALCALLALLPGPGAKAARPAGGTISPRATTLTWQGAYFAVGATRFSATTCRTPAPVGGALCDQFVLTVDVEAGYWDRRLGGAEVSISWADPADVFGLSVFRRGHETPVASALASGESSAQVLVPAASGTYDVYVVPHQVTASDYVGTATLREEAAPEPASRGPCTDAAARSMPDGAGHDHADVSQHRFSCRMTEVFFDGLNDELRARPDVMLGEMDVESDVAAVAVDFPESGVLFFDVSDPARPRFLSWYRGSECEGLVQDVGCGAFVDLSADGKVAFLSVQSLTVVPGGVPPVGVRPASVPGVEVIDVSDPKRPRLAQVYPVLSVGGVHTSRSHVVPSRSRGNGPRAPGEYLFSVANGLGVEVTRVERTAGGPTLTPVRRIDIDDVHDTFIHDDALSGRTYLYVAAGMESGFYVYDVTDPGRPVLKAEWDLTPHCAEDWYGHTVDVAVRNGRRFVTLDAESLTAGSQSTEDRREGCGAVVGNGDKPGPLWIVDATDFDRIGPARAQGGDDDDELKERSEAALVATWTNPAGRAGGHLRFSPHNQQIVGDRIYLSHYHGGVYVLDASAAFRGERERPRELGFYVPHGPETRPVHEPGPGPLLPSVADVPPDRPMIWDAVFYRGYVLAADLHGGLYSLKYAED